MLRRVRLRRPFFHDSAITSVFLGNEWEGAVQASAISRGAFSFSFFECTYSSHDTRHEHEDRFLGKSSLYVLAWPPRSLWHFSRPAHLSRIITNKRTGWLLIEEKFMSFVWAAKQVALPKIAQLCSGNMGERILRLYSHNYALWSGTRITFSAVKSAPEFGKREVDLWNYTRRPSSRWSVWVRAPKKYKTDTGTEVFAWKSQFFKWKRKWRRIFLSRRSLCRARVRTSQKIV